MERNFPGVSIGTTILSDNNILFEREKRFPNLRYKHKLRFDFYLPDNNLCIEYQGQQHFYAIDIFGGEEGFLLRKKNDILKKEWFVLLYGL